MEYVRLGEADLKTNINNRVYLTFMAKDVTVDVQKDKITRFIKLIMVDKDTEVQARLFGASQKVIDTVQEGKVYKAAVDIRPYDKAPEGYSCIIYNIDFSDETPDNYVNWAENLDECQKVIENLLPEFINTPYGQIAYPLLVENWDRFVRWTAAKGQHHTRLGELMVHTSEVMNICSDLADYFNGLYGAEFINKPLLLASAMLHDLAKVKELDVNTYSGKTSYSKHSVLCTHIMDVITDVEVQAYKLGLGQQKIIENEVGEDEETKTQEQLNDEQEAIDLLKHCLAAHHGKLEFGSPITASIPEAHLLNVADNLSADMYKYNKSMRQLEPGDFVSVWAGSGYNNTYKDSTK